MDVTAWMEWFLGCLTRAIEGAQTALSGVIAKARYWEKLRDVPLNERQRLVINRLLEGFEGKLTTSKWAALTKSSSDTALRDIQQLVERGVLVRNAAGGRSTSYSLAGALAGSTVDRLASPKCRFAKARPEAVPCGSLGRPV